MAAWLVLPEESLGMEVMLTWPIYILMVGFHMGIAPPCTVSTLINSCIFEASAGVSAERCLMLLVVSSGLELQHSKIALDKA